MGSWIYDRTELDVLNETSKGFVNYTDFNRIEGDVKELEEIMVSFGYLPPSPLVTKIDWKRQGYLGSTGMDNIPTLAHMRRIIYNINILRQIYYVYPWTPDTPVTLENATYGTFNDVEKILHDLYLMTEDMRGYFRECNTFDVGSYNY